MMCESSKNIFTVICSFTVDFILLVTMYLCLVHVTDSYLYMWSVIIHNFSLIAAGRVVMSRSFFTSQLQNQLTICDMCILLNFMFKRPSLRCKRWHSCYLTDSVPFNKYFMYLLSEIFPLNLLSNIVFPTHPGVVSSLWNCKLVTMNLKGKIEFS